MAYAHDETEPAVCPFVDLDDPRCAGRFSLSRIDEAFDLCLGGHRSCVTYYQLLQEHRGETGKRALSSIGLTIEGRPAAVHDESRPIAASAGGLRPTGS